MSETSQENKMKQFGLFLLGGAVLVFGISLILGWWSYVTVIFKGVIGVFLALAGLCLLVLAKE